ncbi:hypothetical protein, partial [Pedobacter sp. ASV12]
FGANTGAIFQGLYFETNGNVMDYMVVEYRIDGGAWKKIVGIYPNNASDSGGPLAVDTNGDRIGDSPVLANALAEVVGTITDTGNSLDLRFNIFVNNGNPGSVAFDDFRLFNATNTAPTASNVTNTGTLKVGQL